MARPAQPRPLVFTMTLVVLLYALASAATAVATSDACPGRPRVWNVAPPEWHCR